QGPRDVPAVEFGVVHQLPGRVRLRVPRLKSEPGFAARAVAFLAGRPGVRAARAAAACASLVVEFDPTEVSVVQIGAWLAEARVTPPAAADAPATAAGPTDGLGALACGVAALGLGLVGAPPLVAGGLLAASAAPIVARALRSIAVERRLSVDVLDT